MLKPFENFTSVAVPLLRANIDTDTIIPSREMKTVSKTGLAVGLFAGWRYGEARKNNDDFVLNNPKYKDAKILLAGDNFGCGSSREHAVWALAEYGFRVIVAPSFGGIFYDNCIQNGVLPIRLPEDKIHYLSKIDKPLHINLKEQTLDNVHFIINTEHKRMLAKGLDSISLTKELLPQIEQFETRDRLERPWVYLK